MRIAILGAGAMGSIFGAELAESGVDVLLVDANQQLVDHLNTNPVLIRRDGERQVPVVATARPDASWQADLLIVFVKSWVTDDAMHLAAPLVGPETLVVSLQNGWGNGSRLEQYVDASRLFVGVTYHSGTVSGLGVVDHTAVGVTYLGPHAGGDLASAEAVAATLTQAGLPTEASAHIDTRIWRKLLMNVAANPVAALTGLRSGRLIEEPHVDELMRGLTREAVTVARAEGHEFDEAEAVAYVRDALRAAGPATSSMRQDVIGGRRTEIDVITGAVIEAGDRHAIEVPLNRVIYALIKGYEDASQRAYVDAEAVPHGG